MEKNATKRVWNVGKCIANVSLMLFCICGTTLIGAFFGSPIIYQHITKFDVELYATYMAHGSIVTIGLFVIFAIAKLSMIKVNLKK